MGQRVLVLNASYEPIQLVSTRRAIVLLLQEKAEVIESTEQRLRAQSLFLDIPLVIRLVRYIKIPRRLRLPCSRRGVLTRDRETCQYCGTQPGRTQPRDLRPGSSERRRGARRKTRGKLDLSERQRVAQDAVRDGRG